jgi:hypothetical protein
MATVKLITGPLKPTRYGVVDAAVCPVATMNSISAAAAGRARRLRQTAAVAGVADQAIEVATAVEVGLATAEP